MKKTDMTVLVVGGGGREHAIVKKLSESPRVKKLIARPATPELPISPSACR